MWCRWRLGKMLWRLGIVVNGFLRYRLLSLGISRSKHISFMANLSLVIHVYLNPSDLAICINNNALLSVIPRIVTSSCIWEDSRTIRFDRSEYYSTYHSYNSSYSSFHDFHFITSSTPCSISMPSGHPLFRESYLSIFYFCCFIWCIDMIYDGFELPLSLHWMLCYRLGYHNFIASLSVFLYNLRFETFPIV